MALEIRVRRIRPPRSVLDSPAVVAVIFLRGRRWDETRKLSEQDGLDGHIEFIRRHRDAGVVIQAGPLHEPDTYVTDDLVGLALLSTDSLDEARALIDSDPVVQTGAYAYRLYEWGGPALRR